MHDIVSRYVELKKAGVNYSGKCPFHNEKTPSFYVSPDRGTFKCFGCGEGGDVYTFLERIEGLEFKEVLAKLSDETNIPLTNKTSKPRFSKDIKDSMRSTLKAASVHWQKNLASNKDALRYLKERGFTKQQLIDYQIGYADSDWTNLYDFLSSHDIPTDTQETVGLVKKGDKGSYYDRFRDRIVFPFRDSGGQIIAFSGRYIGDDDVSAKYLNSPETPVFNKSKELFGLDMAKTAMRKNNFAIVVEGQVDLIMGQSVFVNTVATSGTALSKLHLEQIKRFCDRVVFVFDNDHAGQEASFKASLLALELDFQVTVARLPTGQDPADVIKLNAETYKKYIRDASDVFDYWTHSITNGEYSPRDKNKKIEEKILPLLASHTNVLEQDRYIKSCAFKLDIEENALRSILTSYQSSKKTKVQGVESRFTTDEQVIMGTSEAEQYLAQLQHLVNMLAWQKSINPEDRWLDYSSIIANLEDDTKKDVEGMLDNFDQSKQDEVFFEIEKNYKTSIILENEIKELQTNLRERRQKIMQETLLAKQKKLIQEGKEDEAKQVLKDLSNLLHNASQKNNKESS